MSRNPYVADLTTTLADRWGLPHPEWVGIPEAPVDPDIGSPIYDSLPCGGTTARGRQCRNLAGACRHHGVAR